MDSTLHAIPYIAFLIECNNLTFSSSHKFAQRKSDFWGGDLFVNFHNISLYIQID